MKLSPDQRRAIEQADITLDAMNMPTYTTLLKCIDDLANMLYDDAMGTVTESTSRRKIYRRLKATGVFTIYGDQTEPGTS